MSLTLLVGPSGVGLSAIGTKLSDPYNVFDIEQELLSRIDWDQGRFAVSLRQNMRDVLRVVNRRQLRSMWLEAADAVLALAVAEPDATNVVLFHPTYFASRRNEQYSTAAWFLALKVVPTVDRVVLLIDDAFDMWRRLGSNEEDLFFQAQWLRARLEAQDLAHLIDFSVPNEPRPLEEQHDTFNRLALDSSESILNLLLSWRRLDMIESESLATALNAPLTVLGVKNPMSALTKLLERPESRTAYLSHPISRPRRVRNAGEPWPTVVEASNHLAPNFAQNDVILVCPTSIDEFRLARNSVETTADRPFELAERWPLIVQFEDAINPNEHPANELVYLNPELAETPPPVVSTIARSLESRIFSEVPFRDHFLVAHTGSFYVFRPLYESGGFSDGVGAEIQHWSDLAELEPERRALFVHSADDVRALEVLLSASVSASTVEAEMRAWMRNRDMEGDDFEALITGQAAGAHLLEQDRAEDRGIERLRERVLTHAGSVLFFSALTKLPPTLLDDEKIAISLLHNEEPSGTEIAAHARFLRGEGIDSTHFGWVAAVEAAIGTTMADWARARRG
jgi:hypothetical protein